MKAKHKRLLTVLLLLGVMGAAAAGILSSFRQQLIYFYTPTELHEALGTGTFDTTREIRVGGLVAKDSVYTTEAGKTGFIITDLDQEIHASYTGLLPALFREGQGVVAQGRLNNIGELVATTILAKHDEKYMPQEVVDALKKSGRWQESSDQGNISAQPTDSVIPAQAGIHAKPPHDSAIPDMDPGLRRGDK